LVGAVWFMGLCERKLFEDAVARMLWDAVARMLGYVCRVPRSLMAPLNKWHQWHWGATRERDWGAWTGVRLVQAEQLRQ
jgi:hypothetical protein